MKHLKKFNESNFRSLLIDEWDDISDREGSKFTPNEIKVIEEIFKDYRVKFPIYTGEESFELDFDFENKSRSDARWFYCYKDFDEYFDVDCDLGMFRCDQFDGFVEFAKWYLIEWEESNKH